MSDRYRHGRLADAARSDDGHKALANQLLNRRYEAIAATRDIGHIADARLPVAEHLAKRTDMEVMRRREAWALPLSR
jgi:hypothetical protein